jgi:hypothetical protein
VIGAGILLALTLRPPAPSLADRQPEELP